MEPIVDLPDSVDADPDGEFRLVRVEHESGGESFDSVTVYDRAEWMAEGLPADMWCAIAQQSNDRVDVSDDDAKAMVAVDVPGWWVDSEHEDADRGDPTWRGTIGEVYGSATLLATVDVEWSRGRAAWSFPEVRDDEHRWKSPGKYGLGGPKSLLPVTFGVGQPTKVDAEPLQRREAREAAKDGDTDARYDWEAAIEAATERVRVRESGRDAELDISAIEALEGEGKAVYATAMRAFRTFTEEYEERHGVEPDPNTMSAAAEAVAEAVRECRDIDDPREDV